MNEKELKKKLSQIVKDVVVLYIEKLDDLLEDIDQEVLFCTLKANLKADTFDIEDTIIDLVIKEVKRQI